MTAAGVIAAGAGTRLAASHPGLPKPLIPVAGRPLAHWVIDGLIGAGAKRITVLVNTRATAWTPSLAAAYPGLSFDFLSADTASSFESFRLVALRLARDAEAFLISTVDALIPPPDVARFWSACRGCDAGMALTRFVDDERPLWADVDAAGRVSALGDAAAGGSAVSCGLYYLTRAAAARLPAARAHARLRDYWTELARSASVRGVLLSKTLDVDRPEDVAAAKGFLDAIRPSSAASVPSPQGRGRA